MTSPLVSVIIPAYNSAKTINRCIDSVLAQTYQNWEAIAILAPSIDNTFDLLMEYHDSRITVLSETRKTNCATARDNGIRFSSGEYILFIDSDDWLEPSAMSQVHYLEAHKELFWCGAYSRVSDGSSHTFAKISSMMRRKCFDTFHFDSNLPFFDDVDMWLHIRNLPHGFIPIVVTNYFLNPIGLTRTTRPIYSEYIMWKILIRNRAWDYFPKQLKETVILFLNWLLQTDLVKWKEEHFDVV